MWSGPGSEFTVQPTGAMDMDFAEMRLRFKLFGAASVGVKIIQRFVGTDLYNVYVLSGQQDQMVVLRLDPLGTSDITLIFDMSVDIEIYEIEVGYIGMH